MMTLYNKNWLRSRPVQRIVSLRLPPAELDGSDFGEPICIYFYGFDHLDFDAQSQLF